MGNKVSKIMIIILGIIIVCMVCVLTFEFISAANSPTGVVKGYLKAIQSGDDAKIAKYYEGNSINDMVESEASIVGDAIKDKIKEFEFEITDEVIDESGNKATVTVDIRTYKIGMAFANSFVEYLNDMSKEDADPDNIKSVEERIGEALSEVEFGYEATVPITLTKIDDKWIVDSFEEKGKFMDALSGGMYGYLSQLNSMLRL